MWIRTNDYYTTGFFSGKPSCYSAVGCYGDSTAMAYATASGGTEPYVFEWGAPIITTNDTLYSAVADTYSIVLRDSLGCSDINSVVLTQPEEFFCNYLTLCMQTAYVMLRYCNSTGGVTPYVYQWNDVGNTTDSIAENLVQAIILLKL